MSKLSPLWVKETCEFRGCSQKVRKYILSVEGTVVEDGVGKVKIRLAGILIFVDIPKAITCVDI